MVSIATASAVVLMWLYLQSPPALPAPPDPVASPAQLERVIPEIHFAGKLVDAFAAIEKASGQRIVVDWRELEGNGIAPGAWCDLNMRNATLRQALWVATRQQSESIGVEARSDGTLHIRSREAVMGPEFARVYDARALIDDAASWASLVGRLRGVHGPPTPRSMPMNAARRWAVSEGNMNAARLYPRHLVRSQELVDDGGAWAIVTGDANTSVLYYFANRCSSDDWLKAVVEVCLDQAGTPGPQRCHVTDGRAIVVGTREEHRRVSHMLGQLAHTAGGRGQAEGARR